MERTASDCHNISNSCVSNAEKLACSDSGHVTRSRNLSGIPHIVAAAFICTICLITITKPVQTAVTVNRRAISTDTTAGPDTKPVKICPNSTPCGWAVYTPFTRKTDYYMKNTCECPKDKKCQQTDDNLSASAYVYRCRIPPPTNSTDPDVDV